MVRGNIGRNHPQEEASLCGVPDSGSDRPEDERANIDVERLDKEETTVDDRLPRRPRIATPPYRSFLTTMTVLDESPTRIHRRGVLVLY